jgi:ADP-ribose pyrophosphatase YjhB (NUDIX family)
MTEKIDRNRPRVSDDISLNAEQSTGPANFAPPGQQFTFCPMCATELVYRQLYDRLRQQCPACGWIHFQDPKVGAGVIAEQEGRVLLGRRGIDPGKGLWCFPSGFMEIDETSEEAAIREFKEETGLDVELAGLFGVYHFHSAVKGTGVLLLYRGRITGGVLAAMDDITELTFFSPDELPPDEELAFESNRNALRRWKKEKNESGKDFSI